MLIQKTESLKTSNQTADHGLTFAVNTPNWDLKLSIDTTWTPELFTWNPRHKPVHHDVSHNKQKQTNKQQKKR